MNSFLYQLTTELYSRYGRDLSKCWIIFPNRRAGLFFSKYLNELLDAPLWAPRVITINEIIGEWSSLLVEDNLGLLFRLFNRYNKERKTKESFDEFYYWGEMLLSDFDDIDKYRVDARHLFQNLASIKDIESIFDYLDQTQIDAIRSFWRSFDPKKISAHQRDFISVWEVLYAIYSGFREELKGEGVAYEGMAYREVLERMENGELELPQGKMIFAGFNALNRCEKELFAYFKEKDLAEFYWDYDNSYVDNNDHEAGLFLRDNLRMFPSPPTDIDFSQLSKGDKQVEFVSLSSDVGQAKYAHDLVKDYFEDKDVVAEEVAVVLADEELLLPVLHSIPKQVKDVNVTMGYPAKNTPVASLLRLIVELQKGGRLIDQKLHFYHKHVLALLNHQYLNRLDPEGIVVMVRHILTTNKLYLKPSELSGISMLEEVFRPVRSSTEFSGYLLELLQKVFESLNDQEQESGPVERMEQEYIYHLFLAVKRLNALLVTHQVKMKLETYYRLLDKMVQSLTIPFEGEPLAGLQVMGILETRLLDFKKIVVLSMNEGKLPKAGSANSFIPFNLRKGFGLPTIDHQDAIFSYYFYRLMQRSKQVKLLYSTQSDGMRTGEMSRFLYQMKYETHLDIKESSPGFELSIPSRKIIEVPKNERIVELLATYSKGGKRSFSPSALNTYLGCTLRFYFKYLAGLKEPEEITEEIDPLTFGNLFHYTMERLYKPYEGKDVTKNILKELSSKEQLIDDCLTEAFRKNYFKVEAGSAVVISGRNRLIFDILKKYVYQMLVVDQSFAPFSLVELERQYRIGIPVNGTRVYISGLVDRIDKVGETIRIIDYKTGQSNTQFYDIPSLFEKEGKKRNNAAFQTFLYCLFYESNNDTSCAVSPGIYNLKEIFHDSFASTLVMKQGRGKGTVISDYRLVKQEFTDQLQQLLQDLYNSQIPFQQAEDEKMCRYCPYARICHRGL